MCWKGEKSDRSANSRDFRADICHFSLQPMHPCSSLDNSAHISNITRHVNGENGTRCRNSSKGLCDIAVLFQVHIMVGILFPIHTLGFI